jgi:hypothetical protein
VIAGPRVLLIPDVVLIRRRARCTVDAILVLDLLGLNFRLTLPERRRATRL